MYLPQGKHNEIMELFDFVIESSKENVRKPDPRFYLLACERANIEPSEAIFLDDLGINLKPAKELGHDNDKSYRSRYCSKRTRVLFTF